MGIKRFCDKCGKEIVPWDIVDHSYHHFQSIKNQKSSLIGNYWYCAKCGEEIVRYLEQLKKEATK